MLKTPSPLMSLKIKKLKILMLEGPGQECHMRTFKTNGSLATMQRCNQIVRVAPPDMRSASALKTIHSVKGTHIQKGKIPMFQEGELALVQLFQALKLISLMKGDIWT